MILASIRARFPVGRQCGLGLAALLSFSCGAQTKQVVTPEGEKAYYIECASGPGECLEAASVSCPRGYEVRERGSRQQRTLTDRTTDATFAIAERKLSGEGENERSSTDLAEMVVVCTSDRKVGGSAATTSLGLTQQGVAVDESGRADQGALAGTTAPAPAAIVPMAAKPVALGGAASRQTYRCVAPQDTYGRPDPSRRRCLASCDPKSQTVEQSTSCGCALNLFAVDGSPAPACLFGGNGAACESDADCS
jgi:hypothetical protein